MASAQTFTTLLNFDGTNGLYPTFGPLVQATNGSLYGTTGRPGGYGTIYKITPGGALTTLHTFDPADRADPGAWLIQATNGDLYGATAQGGVNNGGTIFRITPAGAPTTLYSFCAQTYCADGGDPVGGLIHAADGDLYGTTTLGGANLGGTVFKITPAGALTTFYSFVGPGNPSSGLLQAGNGDFYGTSVAGGTNACGTIFKITPAGALTTIHNFNLGDGCNPNVALIQATNGVLYGTTIGGGPTAPAFGTIFEITSAVLTTLQGFDGTDGAYINGLVQDTNGSIYGMASFGGPSNDGTVFKLSLGLAPFVKTLPGYGPVGRRVQILGSDLTGATSVTFNGVPAVFTVVSASEISTTVPAGATKGKVELITPGGTLVSNVVFGVPSAE